MNGLDYKIRKAKEKDLKHIKRLQIKYHFKKVSESDRKKEGFVSVETNLRLLSKINKELGIIVAQSGPRIVGYEIPLGLSHATKVPLLDPFVGRFLNLKYKGRKIRDYKVVIAGQILVDKDFKGKGIAEEMHKKFIEMLKGKFDLMVSEVSSQNPISLHVATKKLGFSTINKYRADGRGWFIVLQDLRNILNKKGHIINFLSHLALLKFQLFLSLPCFLHFSL